MRTSARQILAVTLVATLLATETTRATPLPTPVRRPTPALSGSWVDRLEASFRRTVVSVKLLAERRDLAIASTPQAGPAPRIVTRTPAPPTLGLLEHCLPPPLR
jgi:hypothetical protein